MRSSQFWAVLAAIYVAPHILPGVAIGIGLLFVAFSIITGLSEK